MNTIAGATIAAEPEPIAIELSRTALMLIDMQRDFVEPGGFGESLGNDVSLLAAAIAPCKGAFYATDLHAIHAVHFHREQSCA